VAIEEPHCRKAVLNFVTNLLKRYDWDGANFAELYFENSDGPANPAEFVPMHPFVRKAFHRRYGYDPVEIFRPGSAHFWKAHPEDWNEFKALRAEMLQEIYCELLRAVQPFQRGDRRSGRREIVVTVLDSLGSPAIRENTGLDVNMILKIMAAARGSNSRGGEQFDFTLNVEDPQRVWNDPPSRYLLLGRRYRPLLTDATRLMLNLNVVAFRSPEERRFATRAPVGFETMQMVRFAHQVAERVLIYCESTLSPFDAPLLGAAFAAAGSARGSERQLAVLAPGTMFIRGLSEDNVTVVDGVPVTVNGAGELPVPEGRHLIRSHFSLLNSASNDVPVIRLLNITGNLLRVRSSASSLQIKYESHAPCFITVDEEPTMVQLDGKEIVPELYQGTGSWSVRLPAGEHLVNLTGKNRALYDLEAATSLSSHAIVLAGTMALGVLLLMLAVTRFERWQQGKRRRKEL